MTYEPPPSEFPKKLVDKNTIKVMKTQRSVPTTPIEFCSKTVKATIILGKS